MLGLLAPTLIAFVVALALGGSARQLLCNGPRYRPVIVSIFVGELLLYNPPLNAQHWVLVVGPWLWLATRFALVAVLCINVRSASGGLRWPWVLAAAGLGLNGLVIAVNGGHMPQSSDAAMAVWGADHLDASRLQNVAPIDPDTRLAWLGDIFAEPGWLPRGNVVSVGDILLALGVASWVWLSMTFSRRTGNATVKMIFRIPTWGYGVARRQRRTSN